MISITIRLEQAEGYVIASALEENELMLCQIARAEKIAAYRECRCLAQSKLSRKYSSVEFITDDRTNAVN